MPRKLIVHPRVFERHPEVSEEGIAAALRNPLAIVKRAYEPPDVYAAAGADTKGRLLEVLGIELEGESFLVYHAMKLSPKMQRELGLG